MNGSDVMQSILILLIFGILLLTNILSVGINHIKDNWVTYKCSPVIMPFASVFGHDTFTNFTYCVQNMNMDFMKYMMDPINYFMSTLTSQAEWINDNITSVLGMSSAMSDGITGFLSEGFSIVVNLYIVIETIIIKIRDTFNKLIGIITTILFVLGGLELTVKSIWAGPVGATTRLVGGAVGSII